MEVEPIINVLSIVVRKRQQELARNTENAKRMWLLVKSRVLYFLNCPCGIELRKVLDSSPGYSLCFKEDEASLIVSVIC